MWDPPVGASPFLTASVATEFARGRGNRPRKIRGELLPRFGRLRRLRNPLSGAINLTGALFSLLHSPTRTARYRCQRAEAVLSNLSVLGVESRRGAFPGLAESV
jgi:hypothetical protein